MNRNLGASFELGQLQKREEHKGKSSKSMTLQMLVKPDM